MFAAHHRELHAYCLRRLPIDDANEAVSEIFLVAWRRAERVPSGDETRLWLYGVARNVVRNWQRSGRRHLRLVARAGSVAEPGQAGPEVQVLSCEEQQLVIDAIATLSNNNQEVIRLKIWEGLSNTEVGRVLGMTDRAVEARYTRAIKTLRKHLKGGSAAAPNSPSSAQTGEVAP
ncbi:MAG TPA: sigma-70 family RNA polymerase sigma factor [Acidimicrobiia bacterium]|jgi:RNA polymerase sigma-70 factor (ECF subfamily)